MASTVNFLGLNSSFDSASLVSQLVNLETQAKISPLQSKIANLNTEKAFIEKTKSKIDALKASLNVGSITNGTTDLAAKQVKSSDAKSEFVAVTAGSKTANQNFTISVSQLATSTVKKSSSYIKSADLNLSSNLSDARTIGLQTLKDGSVTVNGETQSFNASSGTLQDVKDFFESFSGVTADFNETTGKFELGGITNLGSSGDTSNLMKAFGFDKSKLESGSVTSFQNLEVASSATKLSDLGVTATELSLNGSTITIDPDTDIAGLVSKINSDTKVGVSASYDSISGQLSLTNKDTGSLSITLGSNGDISALNLNQESLGKNAEFSISTLNGGDTIVSNSNSVNGLIEGMDFELKAVTASAVSISVADDYSAYKNRINNFAKDISSLVKDLKSSGTSFARTLVNKIQSTLGGLYGDSSDKFKSLIDIGMKTNLDSEGKFSSISFDDAKLTDAFKNMDSLNSILFGGGTGDQYSKLNSGSEGVFVQLDKVLNSYSNSSSTGVLGSLLSSNSSRVSSYKSDITRKQTGIDSYEARLRKQFANLDVLNAQFQKQQSAISGLF